MAKPKLKEKVSLRAILGRTGKLAVGATGKYFSEAMPITSRTATDAAQIGGKIAAGIGKARTTVSNVAKSIRSQGGIRSLLSWYMSEADSFGMADVDFDDSSMTFDIPVDDVDENESPPNPAEIATDKVSRAVVESAQQQLEGQVELTSNILTSIEKTGEIISTGNDNIVNVLNSILEVVTKNTAAIIESTNEGGYQDERDPGEEMVRSGKFRLKDYGKIIKNNITNLPGMGMVAGMLPMMLDPTMLKMLATPDTLVDNVVGFALDRIFPKLKEGLGELDKALSQTVIDKLLEFGTASIGTGKAGDWVKSLLGIRADREEFQAEKEYFSVEKTEFDTLTREAIITTIPGYLAKILHAISGQDLTYDYRTREFTTKEALKREFLDTSLPWSNFYSQSRKVREAFGQDDFGQGIYDALITDLMAKTGSGEARSAIDSFAKDGKFKEYVQEKIFKEHGLELSDDMAKRLELMGKAIQNIHGDEFTRNMNVGLAKLNLGRNDAMRQKVEEFREFNVDPGEVWTESDYDLRSILTRMGLKPISRYEYQENEDKKRIEEKNAEIRKENAEIVKRNEERAERRKRGEEDVDEDEELLEEEKYERYDSDVSPESPKIELTGVNYTNRALYEIFMTLQRGINVFKTGESPVLKDTPYPVWGAEHLPPPENVPMIRLETKLPSLKGEADKEGPSGVLDGIWSDEANLLKNGTDAEGKEEKLTKIERFNRWSKDRFPRLLKSVLSGDVKGIGENVGLIARDIGDVAGTYMNEKFEKMNQANGNLTGYLGHRLTGKGYSYNEKDEQGNIVKVTIGDNEKGGIIGYLKDELGQFAKQKSTAAARWFKEVSGYFVDETEEEDTAREKRRSFLGASIGALGGGLLAGPVGLLMGSIAGSALSGINFGKKINEFLFGRDEDEKATGVLSKAYDWIVAPIKYQLGKTMDTVGNVLKKNILGPLSDLGIALKDRIVDIAEHFSKSVFGKVFKFIGGVIMAPFKLAARLFRLPAMIAGSLARGTVNSVGGIAGAIGGVATKVVAGKAMHTYTDPETGEKKTVRTSEFIKKRKAERNKALKNELKYEIDPTTGKPLKDEKGRKIERKYSSWKAFQEAEKAERKRKRDKWREYTEGPEVSREIIKKADETKEAIEETNANLDAIGENSDAIAESTKADAEANANLNRLGSEAGSIYTHDQGLHERIDQITGLLETFFGDATYTPFPGEVAESDRLVSEVAQPSTPEVETEPTTAVKATSEESQVASIEIPTSESSENTPSAVLAEEVKAEVPTESNPTVEAAVAGIATGKELTTSPVSEREEESVPTQSVETSGTDKAMAKTVEPSAVEPSPKVSLEKESPASVVSPVMALEKAPESTEAESPRVSLEKTPVTVAQAVEASTLIPETKKVDLRKKVDLTKHPEPEAQKESEAEKPADDTSVHANEVGTEAKYQSDEEYANQAVGAAASLVTSNGISSEDERLAGEIYDEAAKPDSSSEKIREKLNELTRSQGEGIVEEKEEKTSLFDLIGSKLGGILSFLKTSGITGLLGDILKTAAAISLLTGGITPIIERIQSFCDSFGLTEKLDKFKERLLEGIKHIFHIGGDGEDGKKKDYGSKNDATEGANAVTATVADAVVEDVVDWANPFSSVYHVERDGSGEQVHNQTAEVAKGEILLGQPLKRSIMDPVRATNQAYTLSKQAAAAGAEADDFFQKAKDARAAGNDLEAERLDARGRNSKKRQESIQEEADEAFKNADDLADNRGSNIAKGLLRQAGRMYTLSGVSTLAGKGAGKVAEYLGASEETVAKVEQVGTSLTAAGLTANMMASAVTGKKSIVDKIMDGVLQMLKFIAEKLKLAKPLAKVAGKIEAICNKVYAATVGKITDAVSKKIEAVYMKATGKSLGGTATLGLGYVAGALSGLASGFCSTEWLFGVLPDQADAGMKAIASAMGAAFGALEWSPIGWAVAMIDVLDTIVIAQLGTGIKQYIAQSIYKLLGGEEAANKLATQQEAFEAERAWYNEKFGTEMDNATFNDFANERRGWFSSLWNGKTQYRDYEVVNEDGSITTERHIAVDEAGGKIDGGIKGALLGKEKAYVHDADGNVVFKDGKALQAIDERGNKLKVKRDETGEIVTDENGNPVYDTGGIGTGVSRKWNDLKRWFTGGDVYETDESGAAVLDENGEFKVKEHQEGALSKVGEWAGNVASSLGSGIGEIASTLPSDLWKLIPIMLKGDLQAYSDHNGSGDKESIAGKIANAVVIGGKIVTLGPTLGSAAIHKLYDGAKAVIGGGIDVVKTLPKDVGQLWNYFKSGDVGGFITSSTAGDTKTIPGMISNAVYQGAKLHVLPPVLISGAGHAVVKGVSKLVEKAKESGPRIGKSIDAISAMIPQGDLAGIHAYKHTDDEGNPIGGIESGIVGIDKILAYPFALFPYTGKAIKSGFNKLVDSAEKAGANISAGHSQLAELTKQGDVSGLVRASIDEAADNPVGGFTKAIHGAEKLLMFVPAVQRWTGNKIRETWENIKRAISTGWSALGSAQSSIGSLVSAGDVSGLAKLDMNDSEGNPVGGFFKGVFNAQKLINYPVAGMFWMGSKLKAGWDKIISSVGKSVSNLKDSTGKISSYVESGDLPGLASLDFSKNESSPLDGMARVLFHGAKLINYPRAMVGWLGTKVSDLFSNTMNAIVSNKSALDSASNSVKSYAASGDIGGIWGVKPTFQDGDPLKPFWSISLLVTKLFSTVAGVFNMIGAKVVDLINSFQDNPVVSGLISGFSWVKNTFFGGEVETSTVSNAEAEIPSTVDTAVGESTVEKVLPTKPVGGEVDQTKPAGGEKFILPKSGEEKPAGEGKTEQKVGGESKPSPVKKKPVGGEVASTKSGGEEAAELPKVGGEAEGGNPLNKEGEITSDYGPRTFPRKGLHKGIDITPADGSEEADVESRFSGRVSYVRRDVPDTDTATNASGEWKYNGNRSGGNMVWIDTEDGTRVKNMHLKAGSIPSNLKPGDQVTVGEKIGEMGSTGFSTGPHLHYQVEKSNGSEMSPVNPHSAVDFKKMVNPRKRRFLNYVGDGDEDVATAVTDSAEKLDIVTPTLSGLIDVFKNLGTAFLNVITSGLFGINKESTDDTEGMTSEEYASALNGGSTIEGGGAAEFLKLVASQIGTTEWPSGSNKVKYNKWYYGWNRGGDDVPWCMAFVQWCFNEANLKLPYKTASCSGLLDWYKKNQKSRVISPTKTSGRPGDIVIFNKHTGILESNNGDNTITTIEGNTSATEKGSQTNGGCVARKKRRVPTVIAYIRAVDFDKMASSKVVVDSNASTTTGNGTFPKYALTDRQIRGIANIVKNEQSGLAAREAEASLMANLVDGPGGDSQATPANLVKKATSTWFYQGAARYNNYKAADQESINAVKYTLVQGKRTLPRYVDQHDMLGDRNLSDIKSVSNNGKTFDKFDRSKYIANVTRVQQDPARFDDPTTWTFYTFPSKTSDPFGYESESRRKKYGEAHWPVGEYDESIPEPNIPMGENNEPQYEMDEAMATGELVESNAGEEFQVPDLKSIVAKNKPSFTKESKPTEEIAEATVEENPVGEDYDETIPVGCGTITSRVGGGESIPEPNIPMGENNEPQYEMDDSDRQRIERTVREINNPIAKRNLNTIAEIARRKDAPVPTDMMTPESLNSETKPGVIIENGKVVEWQQSVGEGDEDIIPEVKAEIIPREKTVVNNTTTNNRTSVSTTKNTDVIPVYSFRTSEKEKETNTDVKKETTKIAGVDLTKVIQLMETMAESLKSIAGNTKSSTDKLTELNGKEFVDSGLRKAFKSLGSSRSKSYSSSTSNTSGISKLSRI